MTISMIVAIGMNNEIGKDNQLLWKIPEDLKHFKKTTTGKTIVMGRKTYESIGKPLPNRKNIVLSRSINSDIKGCYQTNDINDILKLKDDVFIIGGQQIYELFMPYADELIVTSIAESCHDADSYFPNIDSSKWQVYELVNHNLESLPYFSIMRYRAKG
jgi:dihydrofolate reductase